MADIKHTVLSLFANHRKYIQTMGQNILYLTTYDHSCKQRPPLSTIESPRNYESNFPREFSLVSSGRSQNQRCHQREESANHQPAIWSSFPLSRYAKWAILTREQYSPSWIIRLGPQQIGGFSTTKTNTALLYRHDNYAFRTNNQLMSYGCLSCILDGSG